MPKIRSVTSYTGELLACEDEAARTELLRPAAQEFLDVVDVLAEILEEGFSF